MGEGLKRAIKAAKATREDPSEALAGAARKEVYEYLKSEGFDVTVPRHKKLSSLLKSVALAKTKEILGRESRLVANAQAHAHEETAKAFGGCRKCYGKGYFTRGEVGRTIVPCTCDRGKQIVQNFPPKL